MTPGDRIKQAATVLAQVTIDGLLYHRYDIDAGAADAGMRTFREGLGTMAVVDVPTMLPRMMTVLVESGSSWITAVAIVRRDAVGVGVMDLLILADTAKLYGSSAGSPPGGFWFPAAVTTVSNAVKISVVQSAGHENSVHGCASYPMYGNVYPSLWPSDLPTLSSARQRQFGTPALAVPKKPLGIVAQGAGSNAHGDASVAIGWNAQAMAKNAVVLGSSCQSNYASTVVLGDNIASYMPNSLTMGIGGLPLTVNAVEREVGQVRETAMLQAVTTDATPTALAAYDIDYNTFAYVDVPIPFSEQLYVECGINVFACDITAWNVDTDEMKVWRYVIHTKNTNAFGAAAIFGTPSKTVIGSDTNTATWDVSVTADAPGDCIRIFCTGAVAKNVLWMATVENTRHLAYF